jgi:hypothetical protein
MVTSNHEGIEGKDGVINVRVGGIIIINPRTMLTMIDRTIILLRKRKKRER